LGWSGNRRRGVGAVNGFFLPGPAGSAYVAAHGCHYPPRRFGAVRSEAVAAGRYRNLAEVLAAGVGLLQRHEQARAELPAPVLAARQEAERDGYLNGDDLLARVESRLAQRTAAAG
jgi:Arc/MetJ-type ribon-helix-helix transcriptional regulator